RFVRAAPGLGHIAWEELCTARVQGSLLLSYGPSSPLSRVRDRVLGDTDDVVRAPFVRHRHDGLHPCRDSIGRTRPGCRARRGLSALSSARTDDLSVAAACTANRTRLHPIEALAKPIPAQ